MLANHHITKPVLIGGIRADGQFDVVYKTKDLVPGNPWSPYLPESANLVGDWKTKKCGNFDVKANKCLS